MSIQNLLSLAAISRLDAEVLLAALLQKPRSWILAHDDQELSDQEITKWKVWEARRLAGEPVAYIIGKKEFFGREFLVDSSTLIPRPATEGLVETTLDFLKCPKNEIQEIDTDIVALSRILREGLIQTVVDIGTGSGCIAVTIALERPDLRVIATDISSDALRIAKENADRLGAPVEFRQGNLLAPIANLDQPFLLISNPPYIPDGEKLMLDVKDFEPHGALFAGERGLDVLLPLISAAKEHPFCMGFLMECRADQTKMIDELNSTNGDGRL